MLFGVGVSCRIIISPEPLGSQGELIVYPSRRRPPFSKIFLSETAWPIKAKSKPNFMWSIFGKAEPKFI